jgi:prepilin-type processing-associated H-X9-DG protein/prepilin-type N-terminal cleavage/methylation domain-containing protein
MQGRAKIRAFTLVELLSVVAIILVLMALLASVLPRIRESGNRAQCLHNLATLGKGFASYMAEHEFSLPNLSDTSVIVTGATAPTDWIFAIENYVPYTRKAYLCPSNPLRFKSDKVETDRETNYSINYWMRHGMLSSPMFRARISPLTLTNASKIGLLIDGRAAWLKLEQPERVAFPHAGAANILFLDGHVKTQTRAQVLNASGQLSAFDQPDKVR